MAADTGLDLDKAREVFDASTDFTFGVEEEFAILDPQTLELQHRFEDLYAACQKDELLAESAAGELIDTEIEIRSGRGETFSEAIEHQGALPGGALRARGRYGAGARRDRAPIPGLTTATSGSSTRLTTTACRTTCAGSLSATTPGAFTSTSASRGRTGRSRSATGCVSFCRCCSPHRPTRPSSMAATRGCIRFAPRHSHGFSPLRGPFRVPQLGSSTPPSSAPWSAPTRSSSRRSSGGVSAPTTDSAPSRCGSATRRRSGGESSALLALIASCAAQTALEYDLHGYDGAGSPLADREIEENLWRAIRHGMDGKLIDFRKGAEVEARQALAELVEWTAPARERARASRSSCRRATAPSAPRGRSRAASRSSRYTERPWPRPRAHIRAQSKVAK